jgi:outer membrane protein, heavy metal efflux system
MSLPVQPRATHWVERSRRLFGALVVGAIGSVGARPLLAQPPAPAVPSATSPDSSGAAGRTPAPVSPGLPVRTVGALRTPTVTMVGADPVMRLSLAEFMAEVGRRNLDYAAQAFNVPIADAQVSVARLFPNPTLAWGTGLDVSGEHQATSYDLSLTQTILLGGKRRARTAVARDQLAAARAQLDDFLRTLRGTAATAYVDAVHAEQVFGRKRQTADDLDRLVSLNEHRVKAGDIGEIDLVQSRVDAAQFHAELVSAANDVRAARLTLTGLLSPQQTDTLIAPAAPLELVSLPGAGPDVPITPELLAAAPSSPAAAPGADTLPGGLRAPPPNGEPPPASGVAREPGVQPGPLNVDSLTQAAVASRPDVMAARHLRDAAIAGVAVAHGDRWSDVDISVGTSYFTRGTSTIDPTPVFSSLNIGLSVPVPISDFTHGELAAARYTAKQADKAVQSAEWKATIDVRQAWSAYQAAVSQLAQYTGGVLLDAERVRRAKLYSYQHGSASLLDVLTAEQTADDVYLASYDAQQQYAHALIGLGQSTGKWELVYKQ